MNRTKIAAIVFILSAGIIASYAILKNSALKIDLTKSGLTEENAESSISQNPIKWLGKAVAKINDFIGGESNEPAQISLPQNIDFENFNLTEFVAKSSFTQMKNLDQSGQDPFAIDPNDPAVYYKKAQLMILYEQYDDACMYLMKARELGMDTIETQIKKYCE